MLFDHQAASLTNRRVRIVVDLAAFDRRRSLVEQPYKLTQDPALSLSPKSKQDEVVTRQQRIDNLRNNRIVVTNDAWKYNFTPIEPGSQVLAQFVFDRSMTSARFAEVARLQLGKCAWKVHEFKPQTFVGRKALNQRTEFDAKLKRSSLSGESVRAYLPVSEL